MALGEAEGRHDLSAVGSADLATTASARQPPVPIRIRAHKASFADAVEAFNERLRAAGQTARFPTSPEPEWLPNRPGRKLFQEHFLALDEAGAVRGGYILKHQEFLVGNEVCSVGTFQLPISEGVFNRAYASVGVQLLLDAQRRQPLLFGLGMGSRGRPLPGLMAAARWRLVGVPFFFHVVRPTAFLREVAYLRRRPWQRLLLDLLAFSGLGWAAIRAANALVGRNAALVPSLDVEEFREFGPWADELWIAHKEHYGMTAVRDADTLRILYPSDEPRFIRLKIRDGGRAVGWVVLLRTRLSGHKQFGNMRLGTIVDGFASPTDAPQLIAAARAHLEQRGVDLIVSNQQNEAWCRALRRAGFQRGTSNFLFATSPALTRRLDDARIAPHDVHMNRGDGDGPIHL